MQILLNVDNLTTEFATPRGIARPVDSVSFSLKPGESMALVGESGCGKTMTALSIIDLVPYPGRIAGGRVLFKGRDLASLSAEEIRRIRAREIGVIFQDPLTTLNPAYKVGDQVAESILAGEDRSFSPLVRARRQRAALDSAVRAMEEVSIAAAKERAQHYPHEFSGGMRQRAMIAAAMVREPALLIADEPTTALDVTIQAQILDLLREARERLGTAMLLITHDLGIVADLCQTVAVMYAGQIVERCDVQRLISEPLHPYSRALLECIPRLDTLGKTFHTIGGSVPELTALPAGCRFADRCPEVMDVCREQMPAIHTASDRREVRCHLYG